MSFFLKREFEFPYDQHRFPGQARDERVLYVAREASVMLYLRLLCISLLSAVLMLISFSFPWISHNIFGLQGVWISLGSLVLAGLFMIVGSWWVYSLWLKSLFVLTNRRLTKFIYTTPWNRYNLSVNLDKIVDTGAYTKGYFQALFNIGTFTARSSAGNREEKYFFVSNIHVPEDLANYMNKLLHAYTKNVDSLENFRPFLPWLKGQRRSDFMKHFPQFWS